MLCARVHVCTCMCVHDHFAHIQMLELTDTCTHARTQARCARARLVQNNISTQTVCTSTHIPRTSTSYLYVLCIGTYVLCIPRTSTKYKVPRTYIHALTTAQKKGGGMGSSKYIPPTPRSSITICTMYYFCIYVLVHST